MKKKLAVLTVNYHQYKITSDLIKSLANQNDSNYEIFIADLSENKEKFVPSEFVTIISGENKGYAHGVNLALKHARGENYEAFVVINNDTVTDKSFIKNTLASIDKNPRSIIGGKIYYSPGHEYHKERYGKNDLGHVLWFAGGYVDWGNVFVKHRGVDEVDKHQYDSVQKTDFVTGCLMAFDNKVVDTVGFWDESYFLYYEDSDYCERAKRKGIVLLYDPSIIIWHLNAASTGGSGSEIHIKYQKKNRIEFGLKYAPLKTQLHLLKEMVIDRI